ncbi:MAG: hypothetical protein VB051_12745 [Candidatus Pelethousia sp.]|nr:hypothetical protein [Candidatus Pelethousia sp.]
MKKYITISITLSLVLALLLCLCACGAKVTKKSPASLQNETGTETDPAKRADAVINTLCEQLEVIEGK